MRAVGLRAVGLVALLATSTMAAPKFRMVQTQFIAADPGMMNYASSSGTGASEWGIWRVDPGPRGVRLESYAALEKAGGVAPARWKFDENDWWLEVRCACPIRFICRTLLPSDGSTLPSCAQEHGLIMEKPAFPIPSGRYMLAWLNGPKQGGKAILTIDGDRWALSDGATMYDVTHLPCRSARYRPVASDSCSSGSPANASAADFPVVPGAAMPSVPGTSKVDYAVLFITAVQA